MSGRNTKRGGFRRRTADRKQAQGQRQVGPRRSFQKEAKPPTRRSLQKQAKPSKFSKTSQRAAGEQRKKSKRQAPGDSTRTIEPTYKALIPYNFKDWAEKTLNTGAPALSGEFHRIWDKTSAVYVRQHCTAFKQNPNKNRYHDVYCADRTRVYLKDGYGGDYIHASYVDIDGRKKLICTQGPTRSSTIDFWRMIWQEGTGIIVMLCQTVEKGQDKCHQYWNPHVNQTVTFAPFKITTTKISVENLEENKHVTCRTLRILLEKTGETRDILHISYDSWPDHESPSDYKSIPQLLCETLPKLNEKLQKENWNGQHGPDPRLPNWPLVVHCSAGIGRTGTFAVLYICSEMMTRDRKLPDLAKAVEFVRQRRYHAVQTESQFLFIHCILLEMLASRNLVSWKEYGASIKKFIDDCRNFSY